MMGNRSDFLYAWFGILKLAAIEVPIHDAAAARASRTSST